MAWLHTIHGNSKNSRSNHLLCSVVQRENPDWERLPLGKVREKSRRMSGLCCLEKKKKIQNNLNVHQEKKNKMNRDLQWNVMQELKKKKDNLEPLVLIRMNIRNVTVKAESNCGEIHAV